jgi:hypothetical protein
LLRPSAGKCPEYLPYLLRIACADDADAHIAALSEDGAMTEMSELISTAKEVQPPALWRRGHGPKILEALRSAQAKGRLPANPRPVEFRDIILDELDQLGYRENYKPSRTAIDDRYDALYRSAMSKP